MNRERRTTALGSWPDPTFSDFNLAWSSGATDPAFQPLLAVLPLVVGISLHGMCSLAGSKCCMPTGVSAESNTRITG